MKLKNKNILLISPEPWDHIFVSKHHYAAHLARRGNRVFFLGPPGNSETLEATEYENVTVVNYRGFPRGLRFFPALVQKYFFIKAYQKLERLCLARFAVVWSFDNSVFFDFAALPQHVLAISHIVDLNQDFQFAKATKTAHLCLGVSRSIVKKQQRCNPRSYFINHGFAQADPKAHFKLQLVNGAAKAGYAGNLGLKYIDWGAIQEIIRTHPEVQFFFAGPFDESASYAKWLDKQNNVVMLGRMTQVEITSFYMQMDVLLLCYLVGRYPEHLENSHKMMEYLGSGKIIVATFTAEYRNLEKQNLIMMCNDSAEFPDKFQQVLTDLPFWNSPDKQQLRRDWALDNTYDKQLGRIEQIIKFPL